MSVNEIVNTYRSGVRKNHREVIELQEAIKPLFEASAIMTDLDMTWTLGEKEGIIASLSVPTAQTGESIKVKLCLDDIDMTQIPYGYLLSGKLTEADELGIFFHLLNGGFLIDVGANIGWYSILAGLTGASACAFEPIYTTYQRLCKNIELNGLATVRPFHMGLGDKTGVEPFWFHPNVSGASSRANLDFFSDGRAQPVECPMNTLDNILKQEEIKQIDLIKCDVEGGELFVYRGAIETLRRFRPFVLSEMLRKWSAKFNYHPDEIIKLFTGLEYICVALSRKQPGTGYVLEHMLDTTEETNFLFLPAEKEAYVRSFLKF